jgi:hypothetical protein
MKLIVDHIQEEPYAKDAMSKTIIEIEGAEGER